MSFLDEAGRDPENPVRMGERGTRDAYEEDEVVTEEELLALARAAITHAQSAAGVLNKRRSAMARSYRSYNNQHDERSKYKHHQFNSRAKNFVPKTRSAVTKNMVAAATALFSTDDVVSVRAENDADDYQQASAEMMRGLLNIRLDRTNYRAGLPWFETAMEAIQDANIAGFCVAKTYWQYELKTDIFEEEILPEDEAEFESGKRAAADVEPLIEEEPLALTPPIEPIAPAMPPAMPPAAPPAMPPAMPADAAIPEAPMQAAPPVQPPVSPPPSPGGTPLHGAPTPPPAPMPVAPIAPPRTFTYEEERVIKDRPFIDLIPPENVIPDLAAPSKDVVQGGLFFIVQYPMHVGDVRAMMREGHQFMGGGAWRDIPDEVMVEAVMDYTAQSVRLARGQGQDRFDRNNQPKITDLDIVWVHENFVRKNSCDYHFWTLGTRKLLTTPRETIESYPAHQGERPYVLGKGAIEAHSVLPMSPVESWEPLQNELNDARNLTNDTMRQSIAPIAKVVRGKQVDLRNVRERGPDATIMVTDKDDVTFDRAPEATATAFVWQDRIAVEMDELSGNFSQSAVQQNRNLNETVGGMKLLSGTASGKTEFDLRIFVETWVEPVLRQVVWLLQYYETDDVLIALAGDKAKLWQRFGLDPLIDNLLEEQVTVRVNVGIGAADPMQKLAKFQQAVTILGNMANTGIFAGQVEARAEPIFDEVFGLAGYKESNRFFSFKTPEEAQASQEQKLPPEVQLKMKELELREKEIQAQMQEAVARNDTDKQIAAANNHTKIQIEKMRIQGAMMKQAAAARQELMLNDRMARQTEGREMRQSQLQERDSMRQEQREERQIRFQSQAEDEREARRSRNEAAREDRRMRLESEKERRGAGLQGTKDGIKSNREDRLNEARRRDDIMKMQMQAALRSQAMQQQAQLRGAPGGGQRPAQRPPQQGMIPAGM